MNPLKSLIDFLLPRFCIICNQPFRPIICPDCFNEFIPAGSENEIMNTVRLALASDIHFDSAICLWKFEGNVQNMIHHLKYNDFWSIGQLVAPFFIAEIDRLKIPKSESLLIPVPLHRSRERERGYNQAEILCRSLSKISGIASNVQILKRTRYTHSQTKLSLKERKINVEGAFQYVDKNSHLRDKIILLVDDVLTTGATTNACAKELKKGKPRKIIVCTIAKA